MTPAEIKTIGSSITQTLKVIKKNKESTIALIHSIGEVVSNIFNRNKNLVIADAINKYNQSDLLEKINEEMEESKLNSEKQDLIRNNIQNLKRDIVVSDEFKNTPNMPLEVSVAVEKSGDLAFLKSIKIEYYAQVTQYQVSKLKKN